MHLRDYLEHLKSKPEDVRRRIALGSSLGITGVVAIGWMVALGASGTLALSVPVATETKNGFAVAAEETKTGFSSLLGAASAFNSGTTGAGSLTIVGERASSTLDTNTDTTEGKTVIPF